MGYIYQITNIITQDRYIGKTKQTPERRWRKHIQNSKTNETYLYRAMRKYGVSNFRVSILEQTESNLDDRERHYITEIQPEYNMTLGGDGGNTSSSIQFKNAMRRYHSRKPKTEYATYGMLGKHQSQKQRESTREANRCPVICDGVFYESVGVAQQNLPGISVRKRIDSANHPTFYRLREKTRRR